MRHQMGRLCGDFRPLISRILVSPGVRAIWRLFWRPVSASKNSVPGGWALSARIRGFALPQFGKSSAFGRWSVWRVTDGFNAMTVGIKNEGPIIMRMIGAQAG